MESLVHVSAQQTATPAWFHTVVGTFSQQKKRSLHLRSTRNRQFPILQTERLLRRVFYRVDFCSPIREALVVFIHEMTVSECRELLARAQFGRLACAHNNQPYIVPMNFALNGDYLYLYGFTTFGQKVEWMRSNPLVCFEIDDVINHSHWSSIVVFGQYEELPDTPEFETSRRRAHAYLQKRAMWWEPAYTSQEHQDSPHSLTPIFFRIKIERMTGHRANPNDENVAVIRSNEEARSRNARVRFRNSL